MLLSKALNSLIDPDSRLGPVAIMHTHLLYQIHRGGDAIGIAKHSARALYPLLQYQIRALRSIT